MPPLLTLTHKLETVVCDARTANYRPSELAMALLKRELVTINARDTDEKRQRAEVFNACLQPLMMLCKINPVVLNGVEDAVDCALKEYDSPPGLLGGGNISTSSNAGDEMFFSTKQRLVWRLSNRTLRQLRPTSKLRKHHRLPTICENSLVHNGPFAEPTWMQIKINHCKTRVRPVPSPHSSIVDAMAEEHDDDSDEEERDEEAEEASVMESEEQVVVNSKKSAASSDERHEEEHMETNEGEEEVTGVVLAEEDKKTEEQEEKMEEIESGEVVGSVVEEDLTTTMSRDNSSNAGAVCSSDDGSSDNSANTCTNVDAADIVGTQQHEQSYCQVAKRRREDNRSNNNKKEPSIATFATSTSLNSSSFSVMQQQGSPLSKITLTPSLSSSTINAGSSTSSLGGGSGSLTSFTSPPSAMLMQSPPAIPRAMWWRHEDGGDERNYYGYHNLRLVGMLGIIEGIDGEVDGDGEEEYASTHHTSPSATTSKKIGGRSKKQFHKRKIPRVKLDLVAHPR